MTSQSSQPALVERGKDSAASLAYVLITPARNEAEFIEETIQAVVAQTVRPVRWIIVNDGSTDGTDEIVKRYSDKHTWIELVSLNHHKERSFSGKVSAFNAGYARLRGIDYDVIGNLDADITFDEAYLEFLLSKFRDNPALGVAGTPFREGTQQYDYRFTSIEHVSGACQLFRLECYEQIGGYRPSKTGGIDLIAVISARMKGWQTRTFVEKTCFHHRSMGTAKQSELMVAYRGGKGDYMLGTHPLWELLRTPYQITRRPLILGGCLRLIGFSWALITRTEKAVTADFVRFRRMEQMQRMRDFLARTARLRDLRHEVTKKLQRVFWVYLTKNFMIRTLSEVRESVPTKPCSLVAITLGNYSRVRDFREESRVSEYREKLARKEIGFFADCTGRMVGSIWATLNDAQKPTIVRTYMRLMPNEALIHDIVTGENFRGMGVGPFMVGRIAAILLNDYRVSRIIIDVNSRNSASLRMMEKAGLKVKEQMLYISAFGRLVLQRAVGR
jgi:poly-beta-1,6-N-acetyl-D-glucosamine synthase